MNNAVVIFLHSVEKVNTVVSTGTEVNDTFVSVLPLDTPVVKVTLSNVPPFIRDKRTVETRKDSVSTQESVLRMQVTSVKTRGVPQKASIYDYQQQDWGPEPGV